MFYQAPDHLSDQALLAYLVGGLMLYSVVVGVVYRAASVFRFRDEQQVFAIFWIITLPGWLGCYACSLCIRLIMRWRMKPRIPSAWWINRR